MNPGGDPQAPKTTYAPDTLQRIALGGMVLLAIITFFLANLHAFLWQSSSWLVSTVLPAVVVDLTNEEREALHETPLTRNATLDEAARMKAEHMAKNEYFAHYAPDGTSPWYWFDEAGYTYAHAGENLAIHFTDSSEVVEAWMNSPKHRQNIVDGKFTQIGVGTAKGRFEGYDTVYVVQLFGTPAVAPAPVPQPPRVVETPAVVEPISASSTTPEVVAASSTDTEPARVLAAESSMSSSTPAHSDVAASTTVAAESAPVAASEDSIVVESSLIATSSGLVVATVYNDPAAAQTYPVSGLATQPNELLQRIYTVLAGMVVGLLCISVVREVRRHRYVQVAYGVLLLCVMGGLWFIHALLTAGAVVV